MNVSSLFNEAGFSHPVGRVVRTFSPIRACRVGRDYHLWNLVNCLQFGVDVYSMLFLQCSSILCCWQAITLPTLFFKKSKQTYLKIKLTRILSDYLSWPIWGNVTIYNIAKWDLRTKIQNLCFILDSLCVYVQHVNKWDRSIVSISVQPQTKHCYKHVHTQ